MRRTASSHFGVGRSPLCLGKSSSYIPTHITTTSSIVPQMTTNVKQCEKRILYPQFSTTTLSHNDTAFHHLKRRNWFPCCFRLSKPALDADILSMVTINLAPFPISAFSESVSVASDLIQPNTSGPIYHLLSKDGIGACKC